MEGLRIRGTHSISVVVEKSIDKALQSKLIKRRQQRLEGVFPRDRKGLGAEKQRHLSPPGWVARPGEEPVRGLAVCSQERALGFK